MSFTFLAVLLCFMRSYKHTHIRARTHAPTHGERGQNGEGSDQGTCNNFGSFSMDSSVKRANFLKLLEQQNNGQLLFLICSNALPFHTFYLYQNTGYRAVVRHPPTPPDFALYPISLGTFVGHEVRFAGKLGQCFLFLALSEEYP